MTNELTRRAVARGAAWAVPAVVVAAASPATAASAPPALGCGAISCALPPGNKDHDVVLANVGTCAIDSFTVTMTVDTQDLGGGRDPWTGEPVVTGVMVQVSPPDGSDAGHVGMDAGQTATETFTVPGLAAGASLQGWFVSVFVQGTGVYGTVSMTFDGVDANGVAVTPCSSSFTFNR